MTPYVYQLTHLPSGKIYIGSQYNSNAHPSALWSTYFTSSTVVKRMIAEEGSSCWRIDLVEVYETVAQTTEREGQLQIEAYSRDKTQLLNKRVGNKKFNVSGPMSDETKQKLSDAKRGKTGWPKGKPLSAETKRKLSESKKGVPRNLSDESRSSMARKLREQRLGVPKSDEHRRNISMAKTGKRLGPQSEEHKIKRAAARAIPFRLVDPTGTEHIVTTGLQKFCDKHGLSYGKMSASIGIGPINNYRPGAGESARACVGWSIERCLLT